MIGVRFLFQMKVTYSIRTASRAPLCRKAHSKCQEVGRDSKVPIGRSQDQSSPARSMRWRQPWVAAPDSCDTPSTITDSTECERLERSFILVPAVAL